MTVPLDNLYDWISEIRDDILIYRFWPHGSRNLSDLQQVNDRYLRKSLEQRLRMIPVIAHDQEPLNFDLYQNTGQSLREFWMRRGGHHPVVRCHDHPRFWDLMAKQNLNSVIMDPSLADKHILLHSERWGPDLRRYVSHSFVPAHWWSHAMIARDWFRYAEHDARLRSAERFSHWFNIYCRAWTGSRQYRLDFMMGLLQRGLEKHSRVTFGHKDQDHHYSDLRSDMIVPWPDLTPDSTSSATYDADHYQQSAIDVVLETICFDDRNHLTEKILRPIACGKPFILVSSAGSLKYLREYGFRSFDGIIDESYDHETNHVQRLDKILVEMSRLTSMSHASQTTTWQQLYEIAEYNKKRFFSPEFSKQVSQELRQNL